MKWTRLHSPRVAFCFGAVLMTLMPILRSAFGNHWWMALISMALLVAGYFVVYFSGDPEIEAFRAGYIIGRIDAHRDHHEGR